MTAIRTSTPPAPLKGKIECSRVLTRWCVDVRVSGFVHSYGRCAQEAGAPLPGTKPLTMTGDIASEMVAGADRFLLKQIEESAAQAGESLEAGFFVGGGLSGFG